MTVIAVTGLRREARIVAGPRVRTVVGGSGKYLRKRLADAFGDGGAAGIISIGIGGALSPTLAVGDCVVAREVISNGNRLPVDDEWYGCLMARLPDAKSGIIIGSYEPVSDPAAKARLHDRSGANVVDMESETAARFAQRNRIPFAALRVISDDARQTLPPAVRVAMDDKGGIALGAVLLSLLKAPSQMPDLLRTRRDSETAFAALLRSRDALGLFLGCPYLG
jgi:adenosylhomocysteine nucleosidase